MKTIGLCVFYTLNSPKYLLARDMFFYLCAFWKLYFFDVLNCWRIYTFQKGGKEQV